MYSCADVIYGIPITRKMDQWLQSDEAEKLGLPECFDEIEGFTVMYSGNADHQVGYLGVSLCGMDVINPVEFVKDSKGRITGLRVAKDTLATETQDFDLCPTADQVQKVFADYNALHPELQKRCPNIGVHIVWSTS